MICTCSLRIQPHIDLHLAVEGLVDDDGGVDLRGALQEVPHHPAERLTRSGNSLALLIDKPLLEALGIDAETELKLSTDGDVLVVAPVRDRKRTKKVAELVAEAHERYGGVFRRLAE